MSCSVDFYHETFHRAAKRHWCIECGGSIYPGERYAACRGVFEGDFWNAKQHIHCYHIARLANYGTSAMHRLNESLKCLTAPVRHRNGEIEYPDCVEFGGITTMLGEMKHEDEFYPTVHRMWNGQISGCREVFADGSGI